jgi:AAA lid domain
MGDHRDDLAVIAAGYGDEMAGFISSNPGLPSRFPRTIHFPDYTTDELPSIFQGMCERDQYRPSADALDGLRHYLADLPRTREFGNGRLVRNLFEAALVRQASRVIASGSTDLTTLTLLDLGLPDDPSKAQTSVLSR